MTRRSTGSWIALLAFALASVAVGAVQLLTGATWQAFDTTGRTIEQLAAESPDAVRLADFAVRVDGLHIAAFGLVLAVIAAGPYRAGRRWAWWAAWALPAAGIGFGAVLAAYGAVGPATSATVVSVIAAIALLIDRPTRGAGT